MLKDNKSKIVLLGAGKMGQAIAWDLCNRAPFYRASVIDKDESSLQKLSKTCPRGNIDTLTFDCDDLIRLRPIFQDASLVIGAVSYKYNLALTKLAFECRTNWIDLGGNNDVVDLQFKLHRKAVEKDISIIPDCGLAPGMVNILGAALFNSLTQMQEMHFRVGGLPVNPKPPLGYELCFSPEGLINEYVEPVRLISDGQIRERPGLSDLEILDFGTPLGDLEAFNTSGGISTMIESFKGKVNHLDYKTIRYPGHMEKIRLLADLGLFDLNLDKNSLNFDISPRQLMIHVFKKLGWVEEDVVVLKAWAIGKKNKERYRTEFTLVDYFDPETGFTAMARTTGFSAAVVARMILDGRINQRGVLRQEISINPEEFIQDLRERKVDIDFCEVKS